MLKYYIILQPSIRNMGGEEMYTRNIIISARERGYTPIVLHCSGREGKIYIEDLKPFSENYFSEFLYPIGVLSKRRVQNFKNKILNMFPCCDSESVVESHEMLVAEWGELIAATLGIRHLVYMLLEHNVISNASLYDFFKFKYKRRELVGIVKETIPELFRNFEVGTTGYHLPAYCSNVYEDIPCPEEFRVPVADFTLGSIGRTNKKYVQPMIESIINFIDSYPDKIFNILYIGGSADAKSEEMVKERFSSLPNAKLIFTGMIFPLSIEMIKQMDVCIASSGSCSSSEGCGVPTICLDANDSKAIGIYKRTTSNFLFRGIGEPPIDIKSLLEDVLIKGKYKKENRISYVNVDFSSHWEFVDKMSKNREYYNMDNIRLSLKTKMKARILGYSYEMPTGTFIDKCWKTIVKFNN